MSTTDLQIAPGSIVEVRDAVWLVTSTAQSTSGLLIHVQGLSGLVRDTTAAFYSDLDTITPLDPADAIVREDTSPGYRRAKLWLEATLRKTAVPLGQDGLTVSTQMLVDSLGYQRSAVRQALSSDNLRPRILLADAVGLGKTVEIGMILSELVRRGRGERILIVTPKHVLEQMQFEMWTRFALPFVRLDSVGIQRVRRELPATRNPFSFYKRAIISIDTLKQEKYRAHLAKHRWDAVVIDESHNTTGNTLTNRLTKLLAANTEALILASATPHNGKKESFAELIRFLEPTAVSPEGEISEAELKRLIIRRHRHSPEVAQEVGPDWAERLEPNNVLVPASVAENAVATELAETWLHPASGVSPYSGETKALFPWTLAKAFLSSPAALEDSIGERLKRLGDAEGAKRTERDALERLRKLVTTDPASSAKFGALAAHLKKIGVSPSGDMRAVVFSERVATLRWLQEHLKKALKLKPGQVRVLHGQLSDVEQQEIVESFKQSSSDIRLLITGDVASEGVNLHAQCHHLVHFDIPWSLIRIEQRNGRIDRYGQRKNPQITTLLLDPEDSGFSGDIRVLERLLEREHEAHHRLGDATSIMGAFDADAEETLIREALAAGKSADEAVPTIDQALSEGDAILRMFATLEDQSAPVVPKPIEADADTGLFPSADIFLRDSLAEIYPTPSAAPKAGGVSWDEDPSHGVVEFAPQRDLQQRLSVLPQTYLRDRKVTEQLMLATTPERAAHVLADARENKASASLWPEAHYLGPLHPVLDWASDRALAKLGRNEVFAIRGDVESPTVLLVGTLTNRRGQVVASSFITVEFDDADSTFGIARPHGSAREALAELGLPSKLINSGELGAERFQPLIRPAIDAGRQQMSFVANAAATDVERRVQEWSDRVDAWQRDADAQNQIEGLRARRLTVDDEKRIAESMLPDQRLVRALLVVVPANEGGL